MFNINVILIGHARRKMVYTRSPGHKRQGICPHEVFHIESCPASDSGLLSAALLRALGPSGESPPFTAEHPGRDQPG
jgi:hypothetical protein